MLEITFHEGEAAKYDFPLTYSYSWRPASKRGTTVAKADTAVVYFYAKASKTDSAAWLMLTDADPTEISWDGNVVTVHFPASTEGHVGDGQPCELRVEWPDGTFTSAASGVLNILESIVDTPA